MCFSDFVKMENGEGIETRIGSMVYKCRRKRKGQNGFWQNLGLLLQNFLFFFLFLHGPLPDGPQIQPGPSGPNLVHGGPFILFHFDFPFLFAKI